MRIIVSTQVPEKLGVYRVYRSVKSIDWTRVESLVYQDSTDTETDVIFALNSVPDTVTVKVYVNNTLNPIIYNTFIRINGYVYEDESLLEDVESIDYLLEYAGQIGTEVLSATSNLEKLNNCIDAVKKADEQVLKQLVRNKHWLATLNDATQEMNTALLYVDKANVQMREFLKTVQSDITQLENTHAEAAKELDKLRQQINNMAVKERSLHSFGMYKVPVSTPEVLYIRCIGDVQYLTTFCMYFMQSAQAVRGKKGRLLVVRPSTFVYKTQYSTFHTLEPETVGLFDAQRSKEQHFVTYVPVKQVFDKFFSCTADYYIVLDFLQTGKDLISSTVNNVIPCLAYSSVGNYRKIAKNASIPLTRVFFTGIGVTGANILPYIPQFCDMSVEERNKAVFNNTSKIMQSLYKILKL